MKASASLFSLLLASQVLPWTIQPAGAQASAVQSALERSDLRALHNEYRNAMQDADRFGALLPASSFDEVTETARALANGNQIKSRKTRQIARDQNGHVRIAFKTDAGAERIFIADIKGKMAYLVRPDRMDVLRVQGTPPTTLSLIPQLLRRVGSPSWSRKVTTALGVKDVAGVQADGTSTETTIAAGTQGNDKDLVETAESWYAAELPSAVYKRDFSPKDGETIVRVENLHFGNVSDALFAVPAGYELRDVAADKGLLQ